MLKQRLVSKVGNLLDENGYNTCEYNGCFDIGTKKEVLMFIKILENVDSFQEENAKNLKILSKNLDANVFLIGKHTRTEKLKEGIVYERFEIPTVCFKTFQRLIEENIFPNFYRDRGGLYVEIDRSLLRETRKKNKLTQRELAEAVGISKKSIYEHEARNLRMLLSIAQKIENALCKKIMKPVEDFKLFDAKGKPENRIEKEIGNDFKRLGFEVDFVRQTPMDIFAKEKKLIVSDIETDKRKLEKSVIELKRFIALINRPGLIVSEKAKKDYIDGIPIIERKELKGFERKELLRLAGKAK